MSAFTLFSTKRKWVFLKTKLLVFILTPGLRRDGYRMIFLFYSLIRKDSLFVGLVMPLYTETQMSEPRYNQPHRYHR